MSRKQDIGPEVLLKAYAFGVFPMAEDRDDPTLYWMDPDYRGIIPLDAVHIPRRLKRTVRRDVYEVRIDCAFEKVIRACAAPAPGRRATWINERIVELYSALFQRGHAHSVECWRDGKLQGGLYGVSLGAAFFGESMFSSGRDASKIALVHLLGRLIAGRYKLLDTQYLTEHLAQFGAVEIPRFDYRRRLRRAINAPADFYALAPRTSGATVLEAIGAAIGERQAED
jgi:leucyl/phenylalanyl-tRNA--protein transferase